MALTISTAVDKVPRLIWAAFTTAGGADTAFAVEGQRALAGAVQFSGTFGGATVVLEGSNDGITYFTLRDLQGNSISATAAAYVEFTTSAAYIRPRASGGTGDSLTATATLRG